MTVTSRKEKVFRKHRQTKTLAQTEKLGQMTSFKKTLTCYWMRTCKFRNSEITASLSRPATSTTDILVQSWLIIDNHSWCFILVSLCESSYCRLISWYSYSNFVRSLCLLVSGFLFWFWCDFLFTFHSATSNPVFYLFSRQMNLLFPVLGVYIHCTFPFAILCLLN